MGGKGQDSGALGGSSLVGHEHFPLSRPSHDLKDFITPVKSSLTILSTVESASIPNAPIIGKDEGIIPKSSHVFSIKTLC